jgi:hypothetical protein
VEIRRVVRHFIDNRLTDVAEAVTGRPPFTAGRFLVLTSDRI